MLKALKLLGVELGKAKSGSHQSVYRTRADGKVLVSAVVLGKKEIPRGTLTSVLKQLEIPREDFVRARDGKL